MSDSFDRVDETSIKYDQSSILWDNIYIAAALVDGVVGTQEILGLWVDTKRSSIDLAPIVIAIQDTRVVAKVVSYMTVVSVTIDKTICQGVVAMSLVKVIFTVFCQLHRIRDGERIICSGRAYGCMRGFEKV